MLKKNDPYEDVTADYLLSLGKEHIPLRDKGTARMCAKDLMRRLRALKHKPQEQALAPKQKNLF